jgi:hypothetical protein
MQKEVVHLIATLLWGLYGLTVGTVGIVYHSFNLYLMVSLVAAIAGNSAHLISLSLSKSGLEVSSSQGKVN